MNPLSKILITGATGNIGREVIRFLLEGNPSDEIYAGVRNVSKAQDEFGKYPGLKYRLFDFENPETFKQAFEGIDRVFLLRPPHISDTDRYFKPLIAKMKAVGVRDVLFLSVQGAEKSKIIPHNQIERLIIESNLNYIFLRPSYFMQNLTTTLLQDIRQKRKIILPAGKAKFNWIDISNIGEASALLMNHFADYQNKTIEITGYENEDFYKVAELINQTVGNPVKYESVNPFKFYQIKRKEGMNKGMIIVMIMLHFLPRFQKAPQISHFYKELTGKEPTTLKEFIIREGIYF